MSADFTAIRSFLGEETLTHFIGEHHHSLDVLKKGQNTIGDAMKLLSEHAILSAPILDEEGEYLGAVSVADVLRGLVRNLDANLGDGYLDDLSSVSAEELNNLGAFFASKPVESVLHEADLWMKGDATTTLMSVLREGFQIEQTRVHHRIFVCDPAKASHHVVGSGQGPTVVNIEQGTEKEAASAWVPTDVVTQLDLVALLVEKGLAAVTATVEELGLDRTVVSTVTADTPALTAFHHMCSDHKSAVGVLDAGGQLVGSISMADLTCVTPDQMGTLLQPIGELLKSVFKGARLDVMDASTSFEALVRHMVDKKLHRVYISAENGGARSIITLTDVLRVVSGCSIPKARRSLDVAKEYSDQKRMHQVQQEAMAAGVTAEELEGEE